MKASFLLRFDDICPTMNWDIWGQIEKILLGNDIIPILAVVPDNQDEVLNHSQPTNHFGDHVRQWQKLGGTIGLAYAFPASILLPSSSSWQFVKG